MPASWMSGRWWPRIISQALEQTRLLLMDRASQWEQLPASARLGGQAQALLKAGLQGVPNVRSVSLVRTDGRVVASPSLPIWVCCCRKPAARCADVALSGLSWA